MALQGTIDIGYDKDAWDLLTRYSFRPMLQFTQVATVKPTKQNMPGKTVSFTFTDDLAVANTPLTEKSDVTPVNFSDSTVQLVLNEYGNAVQTTALLRGTSFIPVDPVVANIIGHNAGLSFDTLARDELLTGTNVHYAGDATSRITVDTTDVLASKKIREIVAAFRGANVPEPPAGYVGYIHPDQSVDLREETGTAAWRDPHTYVDTANIYNGEVGKYEGVRFVEAPRVTVLEGAGAGTPAADVYQAIFLGQEGLAQAWSSTVSGPEPGVVVGPVTDILRRFVSLGWYWLGGFKLLRQESVRRLETSSRLSD